MGALTAKIKAFSQRPWESRSYQQIDDTEFTLFRTRIEKLKNTRVRILPIKYWIADQKRFTVEKPLTNTGIFIYPLKLSFVQNNRKFIEKTNFNYMQNKLRALVAITKHMLFKKSLSVIINKTLSADMLRYLPVPTNLYLPTLSNPPTVKKNLETITYTNIPLQYSDILLTCNPRLSSPTFNTFLFQKKEELNIISLSTFPTNFVKAEIPLHSFTQNRIKNNHLPTGKTLTVTDAFNSQSTINSASMTISPLFLQSEYTYDLPQKNSRISVDIDASPFPKNHVTAFVSQNAEVKSSIFLPIINDSFHPYLQTKIDQKLFQRLYAFALFFSNHPSGKRAMISYKKPIKNYIINSPL